MTFTWLAPTPDGPICKPLSRLAELVAESATFRVRAGIDSDDTYAADKLIEGLRGGRRAIFYPAADLDSLEVFPAAVIFPDRTTFRQDSGGHRNFLAAGGMLSLLLVDKCQYPDDVLQSSRDFLNFGGNVLKEISDLFASDDRLAGHEITAMAPERDRVSTSEGQVDRWLLLSRIEWGG